jgi:uracil-DNA glycosylase
MSPIKDSRHPQFSAAEAAEALRWWIRAGVNHALSETAQNRFANDAAQEAGLGANAPAAMRAPSRTSSETGARSSQGASGPAEVTQTAARALAATATDLETLRSLMADFDGCALKRTATQLVFADGVPGSPVMFVGEAPGGDEDRIGRPFVGRAGQLLDRMLNAVGLDRRQVYIANVVPWRPPGNRTPTLQETQTCLPFITRQIELADPELLVSLGLPSAQTLLGVKTGITRARGSWFTYPRENGRTIPALAMFHPAYLLRSPSQKRLAWADMRALASALENLRQGAPVKPPGRGASPDGTSW